MTKKNRILVKWPKTTIFSCFEATCSISEFASDSKMSENHKTPNFDRMPKNNVFFSCHEATFSISKAASDSKTLKND
jgi:hypothetical protein